MISATKCWLKCFGFGPPRTSLCFVFTTLSIKPLGIQCGSKWSRSLKGKKGNCIFKHQGRIRKRTIQQSSWLRTHRMWPKIWSKILFNLLCQTVTWPSPSISASSTISCSSWMQYIQLELEEKAVSPILPQITVPRKSFEFKLSSPDRWSEHQALP